MLYRVVLITLVLGVTVALSLSSQDISPTSLFAIIAVTYALSLGYAWFLPRVENPLRFADAQIAGDLAITTALVYLTGGPQSGFTFLYPLSIIGAATVRLRQGAVKVAAVSVALLMVVSALGAFHVLPHFGGEP